MGHRSQNSQKENKLIFTNGELTFTLWRNDFYNQNYQCYITLEKNNNYRITKYQLNAKSIYVWIKIQPIKLDYLRSYFSITTLEKFLFLVDFYNKTNVRKNLNRVPVIATIFQDYYVTRYISEFL